MSYHLETNTATNNYELVTKGVTHIIANTHCIVCGNSFEKSRVGKLYCSNKCKQFGHNHKSELSNASERQNEGINYKEYNFYIDDYLDYSKKQKTLSRYYQLEKKRSQWESIEKEIKERHALNLPINEYMLSNYTNKKLTDNEDGELYNIESENDETFLQLHPKELSLEQWSFIKILYPLISKQSFFEIASSLSNEFWEQLNFKENITAKSFNNMLIKNKFINHCNLIAMGIIKFNTKLIADNKTIQNEP